MKNPRHVLLALPGDGFQARNADFYLFIYLFIVKDHRAAHQLSRVFCARKDIPWMPFLAMFS